MLKTSHNMQIQSQSILFSCRNRQTAKHLSTCSLHSANDFFHMLAIFLSVTRTCLWGFLDEFAFHVKSMSLPLWVCMSKTDLGSGGIVSIFFLFFFALPRQFTQRHYGPCIGGGILDMASTEYTAGKRGLTNKRSAGKREWYVFCLLLLGSPLGCGSSWCSAFVLNPDVHTAELREVTRRTT